MFWFDLYFGRGLFFYLSLYKILCMYNNETIYNNLMTILRKEKEGKTITENQFNELLLQCSWEVVNSEYDKFEKNQVSIDIFSGLKESLQTAVPISGVVDMTVIDNYWHMTAARITSWEAKVDIITDAEYNEYIYSDLLEPVQAFPVGKILGTNLLLLPIPTEVESITIDYLRIPTDPYFDYYYDSNDEVKYLTPYVATAYTLKTGESYIDKVDGTVFGVGATIGSKAGGDNADNQSAELFLPEGWRYMVLYCILQKMGVALNEQDALQYGIIKEQKE